MDDKDCPHIQRLLSNSHRKFEKDYPCGLLQYCHDIETVYEELSELNVEVVDRIKHYNLLGNLDMIFFPQLLTS